MEIRTESFKRCELVTVSGRVDSSTAPELEEVLYSLVRIHGRNVVVNLRNVDLIYSAGLKALLTALMRGRKAIPEVHVVISEATPEVQESFDLVGFDRLFKFYDSDARAIGSF